MAQAAPPPSALRPPRKAVGPLHRGIGTGLGGLQQSFDVAIESGDQAALLLLDWRVKTGLSRL